ncbi:hypothetical protein BDZ94DRAFT_1378073 [Collybia nuda]|uniref:Uncharacterized protein n=1 Tax=Collybia nuda TaxID=64659 RepID=A0A9P5XYQ6_9AGAR|nr:hypothetical protein BDZ94DRAFT_1378073 [Collybia nuda]
MATSWKNGTLAYNQKASLSLYTLTFLLATFIEVMVSVIFARSVHTLLSGCNSVPPIGEPLLGESTVENIEFVDTLCFYAEMSINDGLLMWRAYVLSQSKKWILILPFILLPGFFVTFVVVTFLSPVSEIDTLFAFATIVSSVANFVATCLIGYVYWIHKKDMALFFNGETRRSKVASVLSTLVTTGVILLVLQAIYFPMNSTNSLEYTRDRSQASPIDTEDMTIPIRKRGPAKYSDRI